MRFLSLALTALLVFLLFYLGAQPVAVGLFPDPWDKLAHFIFYGGISSLIWLGCGGRRDWLVVLAVAAIGAADELHQRNLPGRSADWSDFLTDVLAAVAAVALLHGLRRWRQRRKARRAQSLAPFSNNQCGM